MRMLLQLPKLKLLKEWRFYKLIRVVVIFSWMWDFEHLLGLGVGQNNLSSKADCASQRMLCRVFVHLTYNYILLSYSISPCSVCQLVGLK